MVGADEPVVIDGPDRTPRGLSGHLKLTCAVGSDGRSFLREQSFRAPIHISKPHHENGALVVNLVNPTAGLLAGDRIAIDVRIEAGAALVLTSPSATRAHCMSAGFAGVTQEFHVAQGGWLEYTPELFIPQRGARYRQTTKLLVDDGGELLFTESIAPGRVASGESFEFAELTWQTDVFSAGTNIARERYRLTPDGKAVSALRRAFEHAYYGSCFVVSAKLPPGHRCWERIRALHAPDAWVGCGELHAGGMVMKCVANGSIALRRTLGQMRRELYQAAGREEPNLRRA